MRPVQFACGRVAVVLVFLIATVAPAPPIAAPPPPPLAGCRARGAFNHAECISHGPASGNRFGSIGRVEVYQVERGALIGLKFGGEPFDFDTPTRQCGDLGCPRNSMVWRPEGGGLDGSGLTLESGCGGRDMVCTVRYNPPYIGDAGEVYRVVYGEHYDGIFPRSGVAFALYTPPVLYRVQLDAVDTADRYIRAKGFNAFAVREGANPGEADCAKWDWWRAARRQVTFDIPACVLLPNYGLSYGGVLPTDSGRWTIVASPVGDASLPLKVRRTPYRVLTLNPSGDDIVTKVVEERRPIAELDVRPETTIMGLGTTQTVEVTVRAVKGEVGWLEGLAFSMPDILWADATPDAALRVLGIEETIPAEGFRLLDREERTFEVQIQAVGLGEGRLRARLTGADDVGAGIGVDFDTPITVEYVAPPDSTDPPDEGMPEPPVITRAADLPTSNTDIIEGTVAGAPGSTAIVSLAASTLGCNGAMAGAGVRVLGSIRVDFGADGTGPFSLQRFLLPNWMIYGLTTAGGLISEVGDCVPVSVNIPTVSIGDVEDVEGNGKGTTPFTFRVTLSNPSERTVSVGVQTADGTATAPGDYRAVAPTRLTFEPGETSLEVTVDVVRDAKEEPDEDFSVALSNAVGATIAPSDESGFDGLGVGTIVDDDGDNGTPTEPVDLRGTWSVEMSRGLPGGRASLQIRTQNPRSGKITGSLSIVYQGKTTIGQMAGSVKGDRLSLTFTYSGQPASRASGTLLKRGDKLTATLSVTDFRGRQSKGRMVLTDPSGG